MTITGVVIRRRVEDLETATDFYERLTGQSANRFAAFSGVELAAAGPFLLFVAPDEIADRLSRVAATIRVDEIVAQAEGLRRLGAEIIAPPSQTPNGQRLVAGHPDGSAFEYVGP